MYNVPEPCSITIRTIFFFFGDKQLQGQCSETPVLDQTVKGPSPLSDCDCDVANNWVLLVSVQPFTSSDTKHQRKISRSQSLSGKGP